MLIHSSPWRIALAIAVAVLGAEASAATVTLTFDGVPSAGGTGPATIVESGYTISGTPDSYVTPGTVHLDDSGTGLNSWVGISGPVPFNPIQVDVTGLTGGLGVTYDNVYFEGYQGGGLVATQVYASPQDGTTVAVTFGSGFTNLDSLVIGVVRPDPSLLDLGDPFCAPCGHVNIDNLVLAPVPLPASGVLLLAGLTALGVRRMTRRRQAA